MADNRDLATERERRGLSQQDIADLLCGEAVGSGKGFHGSNVSRFETGARDLMPSASRGARRLDRSDYERVLREYDRKNKSARKSA